MSDLLLTTGTQLWLLERLLPSLRKTYRGDIIIADYHDFSDEGICKLGDFDASSIRVESKSNSIVIDRYRIFYSIMKDLIDEYDTVLHLDGCDMVVNDINPLLSRAKKGLTIFEDGGIWKNDWVIKDDAWHINKYIPLSDWKLVEDKTIFNPSLCGGPISDIAGLFFMVWDYCKMYSTDFGMDLYAVNIVMRAHNIPFQPIPLDDKSILHYGGYDEFKFKGLKESKDRREGRIL